MSPRSPDYSNYKTVTSPELFKVKWEPFYREGLLRSTALKQSFKHFADVSYGSSIFQTLDIYLPDDLRKDTSCLIFLHGGAFREGHPAHYGFIGKPYLDRGFGFISAGYRLAPEAFYPDHVDDVAVLMKWVYDHLPRYGLNAKRIVVSGHSSGALMVALASVRTDWQKAKGLPQDIINYVVLAGANYDHRTEFPENLVLNPSRREEGTVLCNMQRVPGCATIVFGVNEINTGDGRRFERSGRPLAEELKARGSNVEIFALDTDHQGTCRVLCDENSAVFAAVVASLKQAKER